MKLEGFKPVNLQIKDTAMFMLTRLQQKIQHEEGLPQFYAAQLAVTIVEDFDEQVLAGVEQWLDGTLADDFTVGRWPLSHYTDNLGFTKLQALCMMDARLRHPENASKANWAVMIK